MSGVNVKAVLKSLEKSKSNVECSVSTSRLINNQLIDVIRNALKFNKYDAVMICNHNSDKIGLKFVYDKKMRAGKVMFAVLSPHKVSNTHAVQTMFGFAVMPAPKGWKLVVIKEDKLIEWKGEYQVAFSRPIKKEYTTFVRGTDTYKLVAKAVNFCEQFSKKFFKGVLKAESLIQDWPELEEKKVEFFIKASEFIVQFVEQALKVAEVQKPIKKPALAQKHETEQEMKSEPQQEQKQEHNTRVNVEQEQSVSNPLKKALEKSVLEKKGEGAGAGVVDV